jgi:hypothetical protein
MALEIKSHREAEAVENAIEFVLQRAPNGLLASVAPIRRGCHASKNDELSLINEKGGGGECKRDKECDGETFFWGLLDMLQGSAPLRAAEAVVFIQTPKPKLPHDIRVAPSASAPTLAAHRPQPHPPPLEAGTGYAVPPPPPLKGCRAKVSGGNSVVLEEKVLEALRWSNSHPPQCS